MPKALTKIPSLKVQKSDAEIAARLLELVEDAEDALRRIVTCGMYIEWIASHLPHGTVKPWVEAHCPQVTYRTVARWRKLARKICEWLKLKCDTMSHLGVAGDELLLMPATQLPEKARPIREKIDALLSRHNSAKQLEMFLDVDLDLKQGDLDETGDIVPARGNHSGKGNPKANRVAAAAAADKAAQKAFELEADSNANWLEFSADDEHIGRLAPEPFAKLLKALETARSYMVRRKASRKELE
jgi:hypothetical protein